MYLKTKYIVSCLYNNVFHSCSSNGEGGDVLTIRDGITLEGNFILNRYCGTGNSLETITSGENASIEFLSDELIQRQGFAATFQFIRKDEILYRSPTEPERVPIPTRF